MQIDWKKLILGIGILCMFASGATAQEKKPNIVFIMVDDVGWADLGCYGNKYYETPNIDKLRSEGMKFTDAYANPNCAPSRVALISGQYGTRTGVYSVNAGKLNREPYLPMKPANNSNGLSEDIIGIAEPLKAAGYATAAFGKWHAGAAPDTQGFDKYFETQGEFFDFVPKPEKKAVSNVYLTDWLTDRSVEFIEKNKNRPFFLYLPHFAAHEPLMAKNDKMVKKYEAKDFGTHPKNPVYAAMLESLDQSVGTIMKKLDDLKLSDNTIVFFCSDNGGILTAYRTLDPVTSNAPLHGEKGHLYEGGIRIPMVVRWPGIIAPGSESSQPIHLIDMYPTFVELAGAEKPSDQIMDGESLVSLFKSNNKTPLNREAIYWHFPGYVRFWNTRPHGAIRSGDFKLLEFFEDSHLELYNLKDDIGETKNLAKEMPEKAAELQAKLAAWRKETGAKMPQKNGGYDPKKMELWVKERKPTDAEASYYNKPGKTKAAKKGKGKKAKAGNSTEE